MREQMTIAFNNKVNPGKRSQEMKTGLRSTDRSAETPHEEESGNGRKFLRSRNGKRASGMVKKAIHSAEVSNAEEVIPASLAEYAATALSMNEPESEIVSRECSQEFCKLGCICRSLNIAGKRRKHCGKPECMIACQCSVLTQLEEEKGKGESDVTPRRARQMPARLRDADLFFGSNYISNKDYLGPSKKTKKDPTKPGETIPAAAPKSRRSVAVKRTGRIRPFEQATADQADEFVKTVVDSDANNRARLVRISSEDFKLMRWKSFVVIDRLEIPSTTKTYCMEHEVRDCSCILEYQPDRKVTIKSPKDCQKGTQSLDSTPAMSAQHSAQGPSTVEESRNPQNENFWQRTEGKFNTLLKDSALLQELIYQEQVRSNEKDLDLSVHERTWRLVPWEKFHTLFNDSKFQVRVLKRRRGSVVLVMKNTELLASDMTVDVRDLDKESDDVPSFLKELLQPLAPCCNGTQYAAMYCDGIKWELVGSIIIPNTSTTESLSRKKSAIPEFLEVLEEASIPSTSRNKPAQKRKFAQSGKIPPSKRARRSTSLTVRRNWNRQTSRRKTTAESVEKVTKSKVSPVEEDSESFMDEMFPELFEETSVLDTSAMEAEETAETIETLTRQILEALSEVSETVEETPYPTRPTSKPSEQQTPKLPERMTPSLSERTIPSSSERPASKSLERPTMSLSERPKPSSSERLTPNSSERPIPKLFERSIPKLSERPTLKFPERLTPKLSDRPTLKLPERPIPKLSERLTVLKSPELPIPKAWERPVDVRKRLEKKTSDKPAVSGINILEQARRYLNESLKKPAAQNVNRQSSPPSDRSAEGERMVTSTECGSPVLSPELLEHSYSLLSSPNPVAVSYSSPSSRACGAVEVLPNAPSASRGTSLLNLENTRVAELTRSVVKSPLQPLSLPNSPSPCVPCATFPLAESITVQDVRLAAGSWRKRLKLQFASSKDAFVYLPLVREDDQWFIVEMKSIPKQGIVLPVKNICIPRIVFLSALTRGASKPFRAEIQQKSGLEPDPTLRAGFGVVAFPGLREHVFLGPMAKDILNHRFENAHSMLNICKLRMKNSGPSETSYDVSESPSVSPEPSTGPSPVPESIVSESPTVTVKQEPLEPISAPEDTESATSSTSEAAAVQVTNFSDFDLRALALERRNYAANKHLAGDASEELVIDAPPFMVADVKLEPGDCARSRKQTLEPDDFSDSDMNYIFTDTRRRQNVRTGLSQHHHVYAERARRKLLEKLFQELGDLVCDPVGIDGRPARPSRQTILDTANRVIQRLRHDSRRLESEYSFALRERSFYMEMIKDKSNALPAKYQTVVTGLLTKLQSCLPTSYKQRRVPQKKTVILDGTEQHFDTLFDYETESARSEDTDIDIID